MAKELTKDNFEAATAAGVALIDFWAPWCGPCRQLTPIIEELSAQFGDQATIAKINVDEEQDLAQKFSIMSIPAVFVLKDGEQVDKFVGIQGNMKQVLTDSLQRALAASAAE